MEEIIKKKKQQQYNHGLYYALQNFILVIFYPVRLLSIRKRLYPFWNRAPSCTRHIIMCTCI